MEIASVFTKEKFIDDSLLTLGFRNKTDALSSNFTFLFYFFLGGG